MGNTMLCINEGSAKNSAKYRSCYEDVNKTVPSGETLLTIAAQEGYLSLAHDLINQGARVDQPNISGSAPLHVAIRNRQEAIVDLLLDSGADGNVRDKSGLTPLHLACVTHSVNIAKKLLASGCNPDGMLDGKHYISTPLMTAAEYGDKKLAEILILNGAEVDKRDWWLNTALLKAVQAGNVEIVSLLIKEGANPSVENRFGGTALHYATIADHCVISRLLVSNGCCPRLKVHVDNSKNNNKVAITRHPPLAASIHRNCYECFKFFLDHGADVNAVDNRKKTPLLYAVTNRSWDCNDLHPRPMPQCIHSDSPTSVDSSRLQFAMDLIERGALMRPVWEGVVWQMRYMYVNKEDKEAIMLCIRAMGFIHLEDFKVETFYRTMVMAGQWEAAILLFFAGLRLNDQCFNDARRACQSLHLNTMHPYLQWLNGVLRKPRSLENICVIKIREHLTENVFFQIKRFKLPARYCRLLTLELVEPGLLLAA